MELRRSEADRLNVRASRAGQLFAPPSRLAAQDDFNDGQQAWIDTPLSPENRNAWLTEGTILCVIGDPVRREALLLVRQQDVELIRTGAEVTFLLPAFARGLVYHPKLQVS